MDLVTIEVDGTKYAKIIDGKPAYNIDGKEVGYDVVGTATKITALNGEAMGHRKAKQEAEAKITAFGDLDPLAAREAIAKVASFKDKDLIEAGKVDEIKAAVLAAKDAEYAPMVEERNQLRVELNENIVGGSFDRSKYINDNVAVPNTMLRATFGKNFSVENGKLLAKDANGNQIFSRSNAGEPAGFDEAIEIMIANDPYKEHILKGSGGSGSGSGGSNNGGGGAKTMTSQEFEGMGQADRMAKFKDGYKVV